MKKLFTWLGVMLLLLTLCLSIWQWYAFEESKQMYTLEWKEFQFTLPAGWTIHEQYEYKVVIDVLPTLNYLTPLRDDYLNLNLSATSMDPAILRGEIEVEPGMLDVSAGYFKESLTENGIQFYSAWGNGGRGGVYWIHEEIVYSLSVLPPVNYFASTSDKDYFSYPEYSEDIDLFIESMEIL